MAKKLLVLIFALLMAAALVACGGGGGEEGNADAPFLICDDGIEGIDRELSQEGDITLPSVSADGVQITHIWSEAFKGDTLLTSVVIPEGVEGIGANVFEGCTSLTSVTLPSTLTEIGEGAFKDCTALETIVLPENLYQVYAGAFWGCSSLTELTIPAATGIIEAAAFSNCSGLESITVAEGNEAYYSEGNCLINKSWTQVVLGCKNSVIPQGVTAILANAFSGVQITSVNLPSSVDWIGANAFSDCKALAQVTMSTAVTSISDFAFYGCSALTTINMPGTLETIGSMVFAECTSLTDLYFNGETSRWEYIVRMGGGNVFDTIPCVVHCTNGTLTESP